jgi:hypothetical protein
LTKLAEIWDAPFVDEQLAFYAMSELMTRLDEGPAFAGIPADLAGICSTARGVILHFAAADVRQVRWEPAVGSDHADLYHPLA